MAVQAGIVLERGVHLPQLAVHHPQVRVDQHRQGRVCLHLLHEPKSQAHLVRVPHVVLVTEHDVIRLIAKLLQQVHKVQEYADRYPDRITGRRIPAKWGAVSSPSSDRISFQPPTSWARMESTMGRMNRPPL